MTDEELKNLKQELITRIDNLEKENKDYQNKIKALEDKELEQTVTPKKVLSFQEINARIKEINKEL